METKYFIPSAPREIFMYGGTPEEGILKENLVQSIIEKIEIEDGKGIQVYFEGVVFPKKGFPSPESVGSINIAKKALIESIRTFSRWQFIIGWMTILFSKATVLDAPRGTTIGIKKISALNALFLSFNSVVYGVISRYIIKPEYMSPLASEFQGILFAGLTRIGIEQENARQFAIIVGSILEYDNAYRYRLEDLFSETTKEKLSENPYRECKRLLNILLQREKVWMLNDKFKGLFHLIALPLLLPKVKSAIRMALRSSDFERLQFDEADRYWCSLRKDYDFFGLSIEERMKGKTMPQVVKIVL